MASSLCMNSNSLIKTRIEELAKEWAGEGAQPQEVEAAVHQAMKVFEALLNENSKNKILRFMEAQFNQVQQVRDDELPALCKGELDNTFNTPGNTPGGTPRNAVDEAQEEARKKELEAARQEAARLEEEEARNHIEAAREAGLESLAANTEAARQEEARKKELEAARQEEARLANIEAAHQKEARKKELEAACQEEARLANIEAARQKEEEEEAHKKELEAARQEEARLANIEAARQEEARKKELEAARQEEARLANIEAARQKEEEARKKELEAARQEEEARLAAVALEAARQEDDTRLAAEALEAARQEEDTRSAAEALEAARQEEARLDTEAHETAPPNDNAGAGDGVNLSGRRGDGSAFAGPWATGSAEYHAARRALQGTTQNPRSEVVRNNLVNTATVAGKKLSLKTEKQKLKRVYDDGCSVQNIKFAMQRALVIEKMNESNESTIDSKIMAHNKRQATIERKRRLEQMSEEELERMDQLMTSRSNSSSGSR